MKRALVTIFGVAAFALSATVHAADLPTKAPIYAPLYNWSGFFAGVHVGYGWADPHAMPVTGGSISNHPEPAGVLGGVQLGYNWQTGPLVFGFETDASYGDLDDTRICTNVPGGGTLQCRGAPRYFGNIDGRLGYAIDRTLLFVKGGAAWSHEAFTQLGITIGTCLGTPCTGSVVQWGWNVGGGLEYALSPRWSIKAEYDFMDFDHADLVTLTNGTSSDVFHITKTIQTAVLGLNYRLAP